jgi:hypothetical protein
MSPRSANLAAPAIPSARARAGRRRAAADVAPTASHAPQPHASTPAKPRLLNTRQRRFVDAILDGQPPKAAAVAAGYQSWAGAQTAQALLRKPHIQEALAARRAARGGPVSRAALLEELSRVAMSNVLDYTHIVDDRLTVDLTRFDRARAAGVRELTLTESWNPKTRTHDTHLRIRLGLKLQAARLLLPLLKDEAQGAAPVAPETQESAEAGAFARAEAAWRQTASLSPRTGIDPDDPAT